MRDRNESRLEAIGKNYDINIAIIKPQHFEIQKTKKSEAFELRFIN